MIDDKQTHQAQVSFRIDRVVISEEGEAVPTFRAAEHGVSSYQVAFCRRDGWVLAAPQRFEHVAFQLWRDEWIGYWRAPHTRMRPIQEYPD